MSSQQRVAATKNTALLEVADDCSLFIYWVYGGEAQRTCRNPIDRSCLLVCTNVLTGKPFRLARDWHNSLHQDQTAPSSQLQILNP
jgi:hypothetical protein